MVCCQTEDAAVDPKEPDENTGEHIEDPHKFNSKMFCLHSGPTGEIRKGDRICCQAEYTPEPDEPNEKTWRT